MSDLTVRPQDLGIGRLFEKARDAVIVAEATTGRIVLWNRAATQIFGYTPSEALELRVEALIPDHLKARHRAGMSRYRETGHGPYIDSSELLELPAVRKDGKEIRLEMSLSPIAPVRDPGEAKGRFVLAIVRNVTGSKRAYDRFVESERRFAAVLSNARAYIYRCLNEPGWPNEFASDYALELTGYAPQDLLVGGKVRFGDLIVEEDRQRVWEEVQAALARCERFELRYAIRRRDGELRHVEEFGQGVYDEEGTVVALEGIIYDVTERKEAEERLRASEAELRALFEAMDDVILVLDGEGRYLEIAPTNPALLYKPPAEMLGRTLHEIFPKEKADAFLGHIRRALETRRSITYEYNLQINDQQMWFEATVSPMLEDSVVIVARDVSERKKSEEALRRSEASLAEAQRIAHVGSWEWDVNTGEVWWSDETYRIYGLEPGQFVPSLERLTEVVHPDDRELLRQTIDAALYGGKSYDFEHRVVQPDGEVRVVHRRAEVIRGEGGEPLKMMGTVHDVTERKALEEQLEYQALHDALTGLPNRALFMDRLEHALIRARRRKGKLAVLFMDLDNFKVINDSLGHEAGDRMLVAVAERLWAHLRPEDTAARLGGDEFTILLEDLADVGQASQVAERIAAALRTAFVLDDREVFVSASIGIAVWDDDLKRPEDLLRSADLAMYRAKHAGKARHELFEEAMNPRALERLEMENDLRRALERREFVVHYQPVVALDTEEISGFEALMRWERPEHTLLIPGEFLPLAEDTRLIVPIGQWTLREACRQAQEWQRRRPDDPPQTMFVNVSAKQFSDPNLPRSVARILEETGLDPRCLELDIAEDTAMGDAPATAAALEELKALGVRVAIDDFGTGFSSLPYLERFPVDSLKIDRSFVDRLGQDPGATVLLRGMIDLAHALGLTVIAEGVETAGQRRLVKNLGCDLAQGNHFSRPLPGEAASALLKTRAL